jgi:hypothetical protein
MLGGGSLEQIGIKSPERPTAARASLPEDPHGNPFVQKVDRGAPRPFSPHFLLADVH